MRPVLGRARGLDCAQPLRDKLGKALSDPSAPRQRGRCPKRRKRCWRPRRGRSSRSRVPRVLVFLSQDLPRPRILPYHAILMRWSKVFIPTLRDDPADAEAVSHKLMLRAGLVRQLAAGIYSKLPLGLRAARQVEAIIRERKVRIGGQEF